MIQKLHHAQITIPCGKEDEGRTFYCGILGLAEVEKPQSLAGRGGFWLEVGDQQVHVGTEDGVERLDTKAHLAYQVSDLAQWRKKLAAEGIVIVESIPFSGYTRFEFRDPFGNRVELIQPVDN